MSQLLSPVADIDSILASRGVNPDQPAQPQQQQSPTADIDAILESRGVKVQQPITGQQPYGVTPQRQTQLNEQTRAAEFQFSPTPPWLATNPVFRGLAQAGGSMAQIAAMPLNLATGTDVSGEISQINQDVEREYQKKFGHATPLAERLVSGTVQGLSEIMSIGKGLGPIKYMTAMGLRGYDDGLKEAADHGITGAQAHGYAGVNAAAEVLTEFVPWKKGWGALAEATTVKKAIKNGLWHMLVNGGQEAAEEGINQIIQNGNAAMHGIKGWNQLLEGVVEAAAVGGLTGGAIAGPNAVHSHNQNREQQKQDWAQSGLTPEQIKALTPEERQAELAGVRHVNRGQADIDNRDGRSSTLITPQNPSGQPQPNAPQAPPANAVVQTPEQPPAASEPAPNARPEVQQAPETPPETHDATVPLPPNAAPEPVAQEAQATPPAPTPEPQGQQPAVAQEGPLPQDVIHKEVAEQKWLTDNGLNIRTKESGKQTYWYVNGATSGLKQLFEDAGGKKTGKQGEWRFKENPTPKLMETFRPMTAPEKSAGINQNSAGIIPSHNPQVPENKPVATSEKVPESAGIIPSAAQIAPVEQPLNTTESGMLADVNRAEEIGIYEAIVRLAGRGFSDVEIAGKIPLDMPHDEKLRIIRAVRGDVSDWSRTPKPIEANPPEPVTPKGPTAQNPFRQPVAESVPQEATKETPKEPETKAPEIDNAAVAEENDERAKLRRKMLSRGVSQRKATEKVDSLTRPQVQEELAKYEPAPAEKTPEPKPVVMETKPTATKAAESAKPDETPGKIHPFKGKPSPLAPAQKAAPQSTPLNEREVVDSIGKLFEIPTFRGRVKPGHAGQFNTADKVIRLASDLWSNVVVMTHEIGHAIQHTHKIINKIAGTSNVAAMTELLALDPKGASLDEGFAEFMRHYLTLDDAPTKAKETLAEFEKLLASDADLKKKVDDARQMIDTLRERNPLDVVLSQQLQAQPIIDLEKDKGFWDTVKDKWNTWSQHYLEKMHNAEDRMLKVVKAADIKKGVDPELFYNLWNRLTGSDYNHTKHDLAYGVHTINGKKLSKSMQEIWKTINPDEVDEFKATYDALDGLDRIARVPGYTPGRTEQEYKDLLAEVGKDKAKLARFEQAALDMTEYFHALQEKETTAGVRDWAEHDRIVKSPLKYYMPRIRTKSYGVDNVVNRIMGGPSGFLNVKGTAKRMSEKGSTDQYLPLEEAIVKATADSNRMAVKATMAWSFLRRLLPSLGGIDGMGDIITQVDPKSKMTESNLGKIIDQLTTDKDKNGKTIKPLMDPAEGQLIKDVAELRRGGISQSALKRLEALYGTRDETALKHATHDVRSLREAIQFWKPDFGTSEKEHIMFIHLDGKDIWVQIKDDSLWRAMRGMRNMGDAEIYSMLYTAIADGFRHKITGPLQSITVGMNPTAVAALFPMDYMGFLLQSNYTGAAERFYAPLGNIARLAAAMAYEDFHGVTPKWAQSIIGAVTPGLVKRLVKREVKAGMILRHTQSQEAGTVASDKLFGSGRMTAKNMQKLFMPEQKQANWYTSIRESLGPKMEAYRDWMAVLDSGVRLAEMVGYARSKGYTVNKNASFADIEAGKNGWLTPAGIPIDSPPGPVLNGMLRHNNEVITNYKPKGSVATEVGKFVPFFTARMAGLMKEVSTVGELGGGIGRAITGKPSNVQNFGPKLAGLASIATAAALYWWFNHDDDDRKDMDPAIANRFWTFSHDGIPYFKIAKPRAYGIFINAIEGLLDAVVDRRDPHVMEKLGIEVSELSPVSFSNPINWSAGIGTMYQLHQNQDWAGRPIDDRWQVEKGIAPEHRTRPFTLESSKFLSHFFTKYAGLSPAKTEYLLNQASGTMYSDVVGTGEKALTGNLDRQTFPIIRRQMTKGLYQRSTSEFYDQHRDIEGKVATATHIRPPKAPLGDQEKIDAEHLRQMDRYKDVISAIRKSAVTGGSFDAKLKLEAYAVGMADYALGKPERQSFPNPLKNSDKDVPKEVAEVRQKFVLSLAHSITSNPSPKGIRTKEQADKFPERLDASRVQREWAAQEFKRLGYTPADVARIVITENAKKGMRVTPQSVGELVAGMSSK
jgi:hypothetical protein